jgi:diadenosine tetraphosphate (Ap4A) HIT family hydrolase
VRLKDLIEQLQAVEDVVTKCGGDAFVWVENANDSYNNNMVSHISLHLPPKSPLDGFESTALPPRQITVRLRTSPPVSGQV